ncbi:MAG: abortive infection family protein [Deltaproteobacteria bacterium]|nr:abortive infection family protein [Deltaproteobacteria bacterium]
MDWDHSRLREQPRTVRVGSTQLRAAVCTEAAIPVDVGSGATRLFALLQRHHPALAQAGPRADDVTKISRAMGSIVDALDPIRNRATDDHPNDAVLGQAEAILTINAMRTLLHCIDARLRAANP